MSALNATKLAHYQKFFHPGFLSWLADNQGVYASFAARALQMIESGQARHSAMTIVGDIRYDMRMSGISDGEFRISNSRAADLARVFVIHHPEHALFWEYRRPDASAFLEAIGKPPPPPPQADLFGAPV